MGFFTLFFFFWLGREGGGFGVGEWAEGTSFFFHSFFVFFVGLDISKTPLLAPLSHHLSWELQRLGDMVEVREVVRSLEQPIWQTAKVRMKNWKADICSSAQSMDNMLSRWFQQIKETLRENSWVAVCSFRTMPVRADGWERQPELKQTAWKIH